MPKGYVAWGAYECKSVLLKHKEQAHKDEDSWTITLQDDAGTQVQIHTKRADLVERFTPGVGYAMMHFKPQKTIGEST